MSAELESAGYTDMIRLDGYCQAMRCNWRNSGGGGRKEELRSKGMDGSNVILKLCPVVVERPLTFSLKNGQAATDTTTTATKDDKQLYCIVL